MAKVFANGLVPNTCGCGVSSMFRSNEEGGHGTPIKDLKNMGGAGWHVASFTNEAGKKLIFLEAYKEFREKWQIVWQSEVRINTRTNNKFILVVYDTTKPKAQINNDAFKYPTTAMKGTS